MLAALAAASAGAQPSVAAQNPSAAIAGVQAGPAADKAATKSEILLPKGTMVRLMVLNEVNSRDHRAGHQFVLRVDEDVKAGSVTVIPIGAKAWGEVVSAQGTSGLGKSGRINARLLYLEAASQRIPLEGERQAAGRGGTGQVVASAVAWGPFGLLMKGNNASLKAGEILNGYTAEDARFEAVGARQP